MQLKQTEKNPPAKQEHRDTSGSFLILIISLIAAYPKLAISHLKEKLISLTFENTRTD